MRDIERVLAAAALLLLAGCMTGPGANDFEPARSPRGVEVRLRTRGPQVRGDLLEVRDSAFVVLQPRGQGVLLVPFRAVRGATFRQMKLAYVGGRPGPTTREQMRRVSRFPQGLPPAQMDRLLAAYRQPALRVHAP